MNYSDYDSDGYSSNEDVDYVPSDDNLSEDDLSQCEKEDPLDESDVVPHGHEGTTVATKKKKKKGQDITMRKRKKGGLKLEGEENEGGAAEEEKKDEAREDADEQRTADVSRKEDGDSGQKKKADDLWASFLSDVGSRPKPSSCTPPSSGTRQVDASVSKVSLSSSEPTARSSEPSKVTITKVFDFAGEEVRVTKEVSADSREAKSYLKNQSTAPGEEAEERDRPPAPDKPLLPGPSAKRPAGMSSLLNRLGGKKQKMSTLEKSKMDWDAFKSEEGITEELAIHNRGKEGYVERKNFLERVDHRQFEREKAVRLTHMKPT